MFFWFPAHNEAAAGISATNIAAAVNSQDRLVVIADNCDDESGGCCPCARRSGD